MADRRKKVTERILRKLGDTKLYVNEKGDYYEDEAFSQFNRHRVKFVPNDCDTPSYQFQKLPACKTFDDLISDEDKKKPEIRSLLYNLKRIFDEKHETVEATPVQQISMPYVLKAEYDIFIQGVAGWGKTLSYALPIVYNILKLKRDAGTDKEKLHALYAVVVVPEGNLCSQVANVFKTLSEGTNITISYWRHGFAPSVVHGDWSKNGCNILITHFNGLEFFFLDPVDGGQNEEKWELDHVRYVVLDEADQLIGKQHQYEGESAPFYGFIQPLAYALEFVGNNQNYSLIMVSTKADISDYNDFPYRPHGCLYIEVGGTDFAEQCIEHVFREMKPKAGTGDLDLAGELVVMLKQLCEWDERKNLPAAEKYKDLPRLIVFANDPEIISSAHHNVASAFGAGFCASIDRNIGVQQRDDIISRFKQGHSSVLISDDSTASGMDFPNVAAVINLQLPQDPEKFTPRISRCGRLGNSGVAISFFDSRYDYPMAMKFTEIAERMPSFFVPDFIHKLKIRNEFIKKSSYDKV